MEHFIAYRYKFKKSNCKKKAFQVFAHIDSDGSGGIDLEEFRAFSQTNPVFLALGHWHQTRLREKLFGYDYWRKQTQKRRKMYKFDKAFHKELST